MFPMKARTVTFEIPPELVEEVEVLEAELGLPIGIIALSALEGYLDGVRTARLVDADERSSVPVVAHDQPVAFEGTEPWLDSPTTD